jgi:hypothetical protein
MVLPSDPVIRTTATSRTPHGSGNTSFVFQQLQQQRGVGVMVSKGGVAGAYMDLCNRQLCCWTGVAGAGIACVVAHASCWGSPASARSEVRKPRSPHGGARGSAVRGAGRVTAGTWQSTGGWRVRETLAVEGVCGTGTCRPQMQRELIGQWSSFALLWPSVLLPFRFEPSQRTRPSPSRHLIQATQRGLTLRPQEVASNNALRGCCTTAYLGLPRRAAAPNPGSASAVQTAPGRRPVTGRGLHWHVWMSFVIHAHSGGPTSYRLGV